MNSFVLIAIIFISALIFPLVLFGVAIILWVLHDEKEYKKQLEKIRNTYEVATVHLPKNHTSVNVRSCCGGTTTHGFKGGFNK